MLTSHNALDVPETTAVERLTLGDRELRIYARRLAGEVQWTGVAIEDDGVVRTVRTDPGHAHPRLAMAGALARLTTTCRRTAERHPE